MKYINGDRVCMLIHADWKSEAVGTILGKPAKRILADGSSDWNYWIEFDEPQCDLTDEAYGDYDRVCTSTTVLERYLISFNDNAT